MPELWGILALVVVPLILFTAIYLTIQEQRLRALERDRDEENTS